MPERKAYYGKLNPDATGSLWAQHSRQRAAGIAPRHNYRRFF
ncbi:MAG: hypothetical protein V3V00_06795 [Saprospiraceae bacterium]